MKVPVEFHPESNGHKSELPNLADLVELPPLEVHSCEDIACSALQKAQELLGGKSPVIEESLTAPELGVEPYWRKLNKRNILVLRIEPKKPNFRR